MLYVIKHSKTGAMLRPRHPKGDWHRDGEWTYTPEKARKFDPKNMQESHEAGLIVRCFSVCGVPCSLEPVD